MSDWTNYLDLSHGTQFHYPHTGDETDITENNVGVLRPGAETAINTHHECAAHFLKMLGAGKLSLGNQQRIARILLDIGERCYSGASQGWVLLRPKLDSVLKTLSCHVFEMMHDEGMDVELTIADLSDYSGYGPDASIRYGLSVARTVAQAAFLRALADKMLESYRFVDLWGEWKFVITEPEDTAYAKSFAGVYGGAAHAEIVETQKKKCWRMVFLDFPAFYSRFSLEGVAYEAAAPLVAQTLLARVSAVGNLSD